MATQRIWNVRYVAGNPKLMSRVTTAAGGPMRRTEVLADAEGLASKCQTWRIWVEHHQTGERIWESTAETAWRQEQEARRVIAFAEQNVPGFGR